MSSKRIPEASSAKRKKPVQDIPKKKGVVPPRPKTKERSGPATRKTETGKIKSPNGSARKPRKEDPKPGMDRAKNRTGPTVLEQQIFESVDQSTLSAIELRCFEFVGEFLKHHSMKKAAMAMGVPAASAQTIGMRYFRHDFTQKLLRDNMLDLQRDKRSIRRLLFEKAIQEADPDQRYQEIGSHRARIAALELAGKMMGMMEKTVNHKSKGGPIGIMAVPMAQSREEWEAQVKARQAELQGRAVNKPSDEKSVL